MQYEYQFLISLGITIFIETIVLFVLLKKVFKINSEKISNKLILFSGCIASSMTLPYLWFILPMFIRSYNMFVLVGEILIFLIETVIYFFILKLGIKKSLILSFVCNLLSFLIGLMIHL